MFARSANRSNAAGVDAEVVNEGTKEEKLGDVVRVMTMHRAKGLEYRAVAMARLGSKSFPPYYVQQKQGDEREQEEKKLLTRALRCRLASPGAAGVVLDR